MQAQEHKIVDGLRNFLWINTEICTAGQPSLDHLKQLKKQGVRAVLNLRRPTEPFDAAAEEKTLQELGLRYFNIPVNGRDPQDQQAEAFLKIVADESNRPLFIHCGSANRVGAFWMIRRTVVDGWEVDRAEKEARRIGLRSPNLVEFARDYIRRHQREQKKR